MLWSSVLLPELSELPEAGSAAAGVSVPPEELDDEADDDHELAVAVGHSPYRRRLGERRLAASARHRQGEKPAFEDGLLYLVYRPQMVIRPFEAVHLRKIRLAELPEVRAARLLALGVGDLRQLADVAPRKRLVGLPLRRRLAVRRVAARRPLLDGGVVPVHDPRDVAVEAQAAGILRRGDAVGRTSSTGFIFFELIVIGLSLQNPRRVGDGVHRAVGVDGRSGGDVGLQPFEAHGARAGTAQHLHERLLLHRLVPAFRHRFCLLAER